MCAPFNIYQLLDACQYLFVPCPRTPLYIHDMNYAANVNQMADREPGVSEHPSGKINHLAQPP